MLVVLSASPETENQASIYRPSAGYLTAIRGQTPGYDEIPDSGGALNASPPQTYVAPPTGGMLNPFQPAPLVQNPFLGQPGLPGTSFGQPLGQFAFGANGPQPYRFGWTVRQDVGWIPKTSAEGNLGDFGVTEFDTELEYTTAVTYGWIFSFTQQYNLRLWDGPLSTAASTGLPGNVHRFGWDFELATPGNVPWSLQLAFNPSYVTDFAESPSTSDAWNWDGRGVVFYRVSPSWMLAMGAGYWDRVNDRVIPYAGAVWTPDDRWEWRLLFPKSRVSYFLGTPCGVATWLYASGEYHVEAYEVDVDAGIPPGTKDKVELRDWRILLGVRQGNGWVTHFLEAGWIFGRKVDYLKVNNFYSISSGFILRGGVQF